MRLQRKKKIAIIGAGVAGLSAGIYALESGFDAEIYEQHSIPGGFCTSWSRKGFTFEGAVHWLVGSSPSSPLYRLWTETGALSPQVPVFRHDPVSTLEYEGASLCIYRNMEKTKAHFLQVSPQDSNTIEVLFRDVKGMRHMEMPVTDEKGVKVWKKAGLAPGAMVQMLPALSKVKRLAALSVAEYAAPFRHLGLRRLLCSIVPQTFAAIALISTLATFSANGVFPQGGALELTKRMADRFTSLGGKLFLSTGVDRVQVESGQATGLWSKGELRNCDGVIVTRDLLTADRLFAHPPTDAWIQKAKTSLSPQMCTFVGIGVSASMEDVPHQFHFRPTNPLHVAGKTHTWLGFMNYAPYPTYAPPGGTALTCYFIDDSYDWWSKAGKEGRYYPEKQALAQGICQALEEKFPRLKNQFQVVDVATPLTYHRYTGSYKGSWMSVTTPNSPLFVSPQVSQEIRHLAFAGFRTSATGGLPVALSTGRRAVQLLCKEFDQCFQGERVEA